MDQNANAMDYEETSMEASFQKTFGWYVIINRITGNDITKHEFVFEKTLIEILNQATFLIQYDQLQAKMREQSFNKQNK